MEMTVSFDEFSANWENMITPIDQVGAKDFRATALKMLEHNRGVAWSCNLSFKKRQIGSVSNEGVGGCNSYQFKTLEDRTLFIEFVNKNYLNEEGDSLNSDIQDYFVEYLLDVRG